MTTKTISITEEAYDRLSFKKAKNESFSEVINRLTNKVNILDFAGILSKKEGKELEENVKKFRLLSRKRLSRIKL